MIVETTTIMKLVYIGQRAAVRRQIILKPNETEYKLSSTCKSRKSVSIHRYRRSQLSRITATVRIRGYWIWSEHPNPSFNPSVWRLLLAYCFVWSENIWILNSSNPCVHAVGFKIATTEFRILKWCPLHARLNFNRKQVRMISILRYKYWTHYKVTPIKKENWPRLYFVFKASIIHQGLARTNNLDSAIWVILS